MPIPVSGGQNDGNGLDVLENVEVKTFNANPAAIGPFGASVVHWNVDGPTAGFTVRLNGQVVPRSGEEVVTPASTSAYRLTANAGQLSKMLGIVEVAVDTSTCHTNLLFNPRAQIQAPITASILNSGDLYFRDGSLPVITFAPGRIGIQLHLGKRINNSPDPQVDIDASFSLVVIDGALKPAAEAIIVDISLPLWAQAIWGVVLQLQIASGKEQARQTMHDAIAGVVEILNLSARPQSGFRIHSVRVDAGDAVGGVVETTECRSDLLLQLAKVSSRVERR